MILTCPSCHARFSVAGHLIPPGGRTARCSKCAHAWHVEVTSLSSNPEPVPSTIPAVAPSMTATPEPAIADEVAIPNFDAMQLPKPRRKFANPGRRAGDKQGVRNPKAYKIAAPVLAACWLVLAFVTYSPRWSHTPVLSSLYHAMGSLPTEGLVFADVNMTRTQEGSKTKFILAGTIRNQAKVTRMIPTVRVILKDKYNKTIWSREYPVNIERKAGEEYPFRIPNIETAFAKNVARIVVDMGNPVQLLVR